MEEIEKEKSIDNYPNPVTIEGTNKILNQLKSCICKIENNSGNGTGFFCCISYQNKTLKVLITNNHLINQEFINENKEILISLNDDKEYKTIELKNKQIYTSIEYDTTIIEIKQKENINDYLELDEKIIKHNINLSNKSIYILQYPKYSDGQKASVSYGIIKNIQDEYNIIHYCCTESGSSGSPILDLINNKIIGIHKEGVKNRDYNRGTILKYPINEYLDKYYNNKKNEINSTSNVGDYDINKNNIFLNKDDDCMDKENKKGYEDSIEYNKSLNDCPKLPSVSDISKKDILSTSNQIINEKLTQKTKLNKSIIKTLKSISKNILISKLDIKIISNFFENLNETIDNLQMYNVIFIPFIGEIQSGKSTIINGIIGEEVLPQECTKKGIIIRYFNNNENEINIRKAYLKEKKTFEKLNYYFDTEDNIIEKGLEQVQRVLNNLDNKYNEKEEDSFYYIRTKIKLFDDLGLDEFIKKSIYLIDLPGFRAEDKFIKNLYVKLISLSNCFVFTVRNSSIKEKKNREILKAVLAEKLEQKTKFTSNLLQSSLFILNNDSYPKTGLDDIKQAKKDIIDLIYEFKNSNYDEEIKNINLCCFNALLYTKYYSNYNYFFNLKDSIKSEFINYLNNSNNGSFCIYLNSQLGKKLKYLSDCDNFEQSNEKIESDLKEIFINLNINEKEILENTKNISQKFLFGQENIIKLNYLKESNFECFKNIIRTQIETLNTNIQDELEQKLNDILKRLDLFFAYDFSKDKDLKSKELLSKKMDEIKQKLFTVLTSFQVKFDEIREDFLNKIKNSLIQNKEKIKKDLKKKKYKEIVKEISKEIKNKLEYLNNNSKMVLDNINSQIDELNRQIINTLNNYSGLSKFLSLQSFEDIFSKKFSGKEVDFAKEIDELNKIVEEKSFTKDDFVDIIIGFFSKKLDFDLCLFVEEFTNFIEKTFKAYKVLYDLCNPIIKDDQIVFFNILKSEFEEKKFMIYELKQKFLYKND